MAGELGQVTAITDIAEVQRGGGGDRALLSLPMKGFPPGFKLHAGDRVVLVFGETGPVVMPLTRELTVDRVEVAGADAISADGRRFAIQKSTFRGDAGQAGPYVVAVVDRGPAGGPEHVIAVRPVHQRD